MNKFPCAKCGVCCRSLNLNPLFLDLDKGNGVCFYLDERTNLCKIYETRPIKCNIDKSFSYHYYKYFTKEKYYELNITACKLIKKGE